MVAEYLLVGYDPRRRPGDAVVGQGEILLGEGDVRWEVTGAPGDLGGRVPDLNVHQVKHCQLS